MIEYHKNETIKLRLAQRSSVEIPEGYGVFCDAGEVSKLCREALQRIEDLENEINYINTAKGGLRSTWYPASQDVPVRGKYLVHYESEWGVLNTRSEYHMIQMQKGEKPKKQGGWKPISWMLIERQYD